jgi:hypothetical protein
LTFADAAEQIRDGDCGRSRVSTDDRGKFAAKGYTRRTRTGAADPNATINTRGTNDGKVRIEDRPSA